MNVNEAIEALERMGYDYTIHKTQAGYECLIGPEYGMCMELMQTKAQAEGVMLLPTIYAAINTLHLEALEGR